jgi:hypothetical protein
LFSGRSHGIGLLLAPCRKPGRKIGIAQRQHAGCEQGGIDSPGLSDRQGTDRNSGGHLHNGIRESTPDKALDSTGTPNTGSSVSDAAIPGKWAAPPRPRSRP